MNVAGEQPNPFQIKNFGCSYAVSVNGPRVELYRFDLLINLPKATNEIAPDNIQLLCQDYPDLCR